MSILRRRHACMLALALLASLLLPLLPAVGRLHQAWLAAQPVDAIDLHALCTTGGLRFVAVPDVDPAPHEAPRETGQGHDCAYCPLLSTTILSGIQVLPNAGLIPSMPPSMYWTDAAPHAFRDRSRGARAPPRSRIA